MNYRFLQILLLAVIFLGGCKTETEEIATPDIIPEPVSMQVTEGEFHLDRSSFIVADTSFRLSL